MESAERLAPETVKAGVLLDELILRFGGIAGGTAIGDLNVFTASGRLRPVAPENRKTGKIAQEESVTRKEIVITADPSTGEIQIEAVGFKGKGCEEGVKFLKNALGEASDFRRKAEWYEENLAERGVVRSQFCG